MADLSSILGGMVQGFKDFGTGLVDFFGTGAANIGDIASSIATGRATTKNQDDFRKWLYQTDDKQDAAAKGLGTILNGVSTVADVMPGAQAVTANPLFNGLQGAIGGVSDELKMAGKDADWGRAAQRAGVGAASGLASGYAGQALGKSGNKLLSNGLTRGAVSGALGGGIANAGYTGIEGGSVQDMINAGLYGAQTGALVGGTTGLARELIKPTHKMDVALTDDEKAARIANIDDQLGKLDLNTPEGNARYDELMRARAVYNASPDKIQRLYHQTSANSFDEFSPERRSAGVMDQGTPSGIFLKDGSEDIGLPGKNQLMFDVKMENPYEVADRAALTNYARSRSKTYANLYDQAIELDQKAANVYNDFTEQLEDKYKKYYYEPDAAKKALLKQDVDDLVKNIGKLSKEKAAEYRSKGAEVAQKAQNELNRILKQDGYDSVILNNDKGSFGRSIKSYIALDPYEQLAEVKPKTVADLMNEPKQKTVADLMLSPDEEVMAAKIPEGQLGLFDQPMPEVKAINTKNPENPYAPVDGKLTQTMKDRAEEIFNNYKNGLPENDLYNKIDPDTLPKGYAEIRDIVDNAEPRDFSKMSFEELLEEVFGQEPNKEYLKNAHRQRRNEEIKNTQAKADLLGIKFDEKTLGSTKTEDGLRTAAEYRQALKDPLEPISSRDSTIKKNIDDIDLYRDKFRKGYTAAADQVLSERLGIAPGNTPKIGKDEYTGDNNSLGRYSHKTGSPQGNIQIKKHAAISPEDAVSVVAHERLHSFQNETDNMPTDGTRYSKEVTDAYKQLRKDLGRYYKTDKEIKNRYGDKNMTYWLKSGEQESRMLQQYLENKGYADSSFKHVEDLNAGGTEWGNEINPAFDKFFDKLRALSKKGVALPALSALFGGGAIMAATQGDDKKKKSEVK